MNIKYYRLAKDEEPPEEFCAVRDVGGEPSEYVFYVPENEVAKLRKKADMLQWNSDCFIKIYGSWKRLRATVPHLEAENAKLRELMHELWDGYADPPCDDCPLKDNPVCVDCPICAREAEVIDRMRELGIEVDA